MHSDDPRLLDNFIVKETFEFALLIIEYSEILKDHRKYEMAGQLFRSGTSIGANTREAQQAESRADFVHKLKIASKEAEECEYWLLLCKYSVNYPEVSKMMDKLLIIRKTLNKIIKNSKIKTIPIAN